MLVDTRTLARDETIETDLCIVGAGAAGIAMALEFAGHGVRVALLESGGFEADGPTQLLCEVENVGVPYPNLPGSRTRLFGGSTNCWEGMCRPLDAIDFRKREWIPHSGWPIDRDDLLPYYERAQPLFGLDSFAYRGVDWVSPEAPMLPLNPAVVNTHCFQISPIRFGIVHRDKVVDAPNVTTFIHANVIEFETHESARLVERVRVATFDGGQVFVSAKRFVLAVGGLENPRLLLASTNSQPEGLGNQHDLVGRFFMEHPHVYGGTVLISDADTKLALYKNRPREDFSTLAYLSFPEAVLERERMTNVASWLTYLNKSHEIENALGVLIPELDSARGMTTKKSEAALFILGNECEQVPNPDSRVTLGSDRDALGMPKLRVDWRLSEIDKSSLVKAHNMLAQEFGRSSVGRMRFTVSRDAKWPEDMRGGPHHMGTTRMADDPLHGVVDSDCRVHSIENLFVAGSSVFPTVGAANPTLTLVALALRLTDHLKKLFA